MPSQCLCRQRQRKIGLRREGDVITEVEKAMMQPEAKESLSHQELEEARNKATPERPDQTPPTCCYSVTQSCALCDTMDCSTPGLPVHHQLLELTQTHVHWVSDAIQTTSSSVVPFSSCLQSFPASRSFPLSQFFPSSGQSIRVSASASVLPMNIQD